MQFGSDLERHFLAYGRMERQPTQHEDELLRAVAAVMGGRKSSPWITRTGHCVTVSGVFSAHFSFLRTTCREAGLQQQIFEGNLRIYVR